MENGIVGSLELEGRMLMLVMRVLQAALLKYSLPHCVVEGFGVLRVLEAVQIAVL